MQFSADGSTLIQPSIFTVINFHRSTTRQRTTKHGKARPIMIAHTLSCAFSDNAFAAPASGFLSKYSLDVPAAIVTLSNTNSSTMLDMTYEPGVFDVVCGRGKGSYNRPGNKRFRALVCTFIPQYHNARSKVDKSFVLNSIIDKVRSYKNADNGLRAEFVKYTKNVGWVIIGDEHAREKVGHAIREAIAAKEDSSSKVEEKAASIVKQNNLLSRQKMLFASMRSIQRSSFTSAMQATGPHHRKQTRAAPVHAELN